MPDNLKPDVSNEMKEEIIKQFLLKEFHMPIQATDDIQHDEKQKVLKHSLSNVSGNDESGDRSNKNTPTQNGHKVDKDRTNRDYREYDTSKDSSESKNDDKMGFDDTKSLIKADNINSDKMKISNSLINKDSPISIPPLLSNLGNNGTKIIDDGEKEDNDENRTKNPESSARMAEFYPTNPPRDSNNDMFDKTNSPSVVKPQFMASFGQNLNNAKNGLKEKDVFDKNAGKDISSSEIKENDFLQYSKRQSSTSSSEENNNRDEPSNIDNENYPDTTIMTDSENNGPDLKESEESDEIKNVSEPQVLDDILYKENSDETPLPNKTKTIPHMVAKRVNPNVNKDLPVQSDDPSDKSQLFDPLSDMISTRSANSSDLQNMGDINSIDIPLFTPAITSDQLKSLTDQELLQKLEEDQKIDLDTYNRFKNPDALREVLSSYDKTQENEFNDETSKLNDIQKQMSNSEVIDGENKSIQKNKSPIQNDIPQVAAVLMNDPFSLDKTILDSTVDQKLLKSLIDSQLQVALITLLVSLNKSSRKNQINLQPTSYGTFITYIGDIDLNVELVPVQSSTYTRKRAEDFFKNVSEEAGNLFSKLPLLPGTEKIIQAVVNSVLSDGEEKSNAVLEHIENTIKARQEDIGSTIA